MWQLRNPPEFRRKSSDLYRDTLDEIVAAEQMGFESAWVSEHHFCEDDYLPAVMPMLAAIAARTSRVRIGPFVMLAPLHHPLRLAEDAAIVDILSNGRLDLALGTGYKADEFEHLGADRTRRGKLTDESVAILLQAWSNAPVDFRGSLFNFEGVPITPKPVQSPIPVYLGGVSRPVLERIARLGVAGVAGYPRHEDMDYFREQLAAHGRDETKMGYISFQYLWVDSNHERARRVATPYAEWVLGVYRQWLNTVGEHNIKGSRYEDDIEKHCIMGSPEYCLERLDAVLKGNPVVHGRRRLIIIPPLLGIDHKQSMRMIETFASEVAPHLAQPFGLE
jgi:probable F420-dependent oxidoreductase